MDKPGDGITVNGQPLADFIKDEVGKEARRQLSEAVGELAAQVKRHPGSYFTTGGRTRGNPGVRRGRQLSAVEVWAENRKRGYL